MAKDVFHHIDLRNNDKKATRKRFLLNPICCTDVLGMTADNAHPIETQGPHVPKSFVVSPGIGLNGWGWS